MCSIDIKLASNVVPFMQMRDRFVSGGYNKGYELEKQLEFIASLEGITGVAYGWPCQYDDPAELKMVVDNHGLKIATLDTDIYTEARFKHGSFSSRDPKIRRAAIEQTKKAIDAAVACGAPDVNLWPGHDGFEYPFQGHYDDAWKYIEECLLEIAEYNPDLPVSIEPKCKEPRANNYFANTGKVLMLVNKINRPNVGITLDFGHSLAALENPAESAVLAMREKRLRQIHINDNYRDWDHDLVPGSATVWEHVEFFYWLKKMNYDGWFCIDIYPYRNEGRKVLENTVNVCKKCCAIADKLIEMNIEDIMRTGDHLDILNNLWNMFDI
ncbi:MAG: sugar phosphate isomerase/epimerase family protein [Victivallales bacterium]